MGDDEAALLRLWREKRGEVEPEDLSGNLIVQLGVVTEELNRRWYEANTGRAIMDVQRQIRQFTAANGGRTHLRTKVRAFCAGRDCWRGRCRCAPIFKRQ